MEMMNSESKSVRNLGKIGKKPFGVWSARLSAQSNQKKRLRGILPNGRSAEATGHTDTVSAIILVMS